jgi:integrase
MTLSRISPTLSFRAAAAIWIEARSFRATPGAISARYIRENTERSYRQYIASLNLFFGDIPLEQIHAGHFNEYQKRRVRGEPPFIRKIRPNRNVEPGPCPASPRKANYELSLLKGIIQKARLSIYDIEEEYEPFGIDESELVLALTKEERRRWLDVSSLKSDWNLVHWYSQVAFETSMGTNEMRSLRLGDVNLNHQTVTVPPKGAKNRYRTRTIPLVSAEALWACEQLILRAKDFGATSPLHYLFPFRRMPHPYDPTQPMSSSGIRKSWDEVRAKSELKGFTPYHARHTALTHWAEGGMRIEEMMALSGHMTQKQARHYARIGEGALRRAAEAARFKVGPQSISPSYESRWRA